jgi:hypothetical protein
LRLDTNRPYILCINLWIHDFVSYDFWAKLLGLFSIAAILRKSGCKVSLIDYLDRFHDQEKGKIKILWNDRGPYRRSEILWPESVPDIGKRFIKELPDGHNYRSGISCLKN